MYKVPNVQLDDERIEEILNKEVDNLSKLPISESLSDSSESMNKFLTTEIGFDILSQKQSITNSTIEADKVQETEIVQMKMLQMKQLIKSKIPLKITVRLMMLKRLKVPIEELHGEIQEVQAQEKALVTNLMFM